MGKAARHVLALHQHRLLLAGNGLVAGPPETVVLGHALFDPAAIDGVELNALTRIAHQGLVEPNPAELGPLLRCPSHGAAIEDWAREPVAVIAQAAQGQGLNPVEKSAVDGCYSALGAGQPEQRAEPDHVLATQGHQLEGLGGGIKPHKADPVVLAADS